MPHYIHWCQYMHRDVMTSYATFNEQHIHYNRGVLRGLYISLWKVVTINTCIWVWHDKVFSYEQPPNDIGHNEIGSKCSIYKNQFLYEHNWEGVCGYLKRKIILTLTSHKCYSQLRFWNSKHQSPCRVRTC